MDTPTHRLAGLRESRRLVAATYATTAALAADLHDALATTRRLTRAVGAPAPPDTPRPRPTWDTHALRLAVASARLGLWTLDPVTGTHTRDATLNRLLGLAPVETTQPFDDFVARAHPDDRDRLRDVFARAARGGAPLVVEFRVVWPDGTVRWLRDQGDTMPRGGDRVLAGAVADVTDRKRLEDDLRGSRDRLEGTVRERTAELSAALDALEAEMGRRRELARRLQTAQEDERRRVARDLHDSAGQLLAGLSLAAKAAQSASTPTEAAARLDDVLRLADAAGRELHGLAVRLRPTALDDLGLAAALGQLVVEWAGRAGVPAEFQATGLGARRLPDEVETALYRVVQEALTNVAKHAGASAVAVTVGVTGHTATAVVEDDGRGFDPEGAGQGRLGLVGMRERVALVGGTLEVESSPGGGTMVIARVPRPGGPPSL
ncbi:PAS domain-containing protein [bacterium]|nr:PAS domain-containing protein [bacterium]